MYIEEKYWNNYIGDSDDSLSLVEYLADKHSETVTLEEIFRDLGLHQLNGNFRSSDVSITANVQHLDTVYEDAYVEFFYAIDVITDLAAILLECKINEKVNLCELFGGKLKTPTPEISIVSTPKEEEIIKNALADFCNHPLEYDLSEVCSESEMLEMAELCRALLKELFGE